MKFLQLKIFSFNTSLNQLWLHQLENNYSAIFLQETNYKEGLESENEMTSLGMIWR